MIDPQQGYTVNTQLVACEVVDSEAVIVNLGNGMYYTMDKLGGEVWQLIEQGCDLGQMVSLTISRYNVDERQVRDDYTYLLGQLLKEELIVAVDSSTTIDPTIESPALADGYQKPELVGYTDMNEVLALDPPLPEIGSTS